MCVLSFCETKIMIDRADNRADARVGKQGGNKGMQEIFFFSQYESLIKIITKILSVSNFSNKIRNLRCFQT